MSIQSDREQLVLELINRARLDPAGEAQRFGIDLNEGLAPGTLNATAKQPLAMNDALVAAARSHSQAMIDRDFFEHVDPQTGKDPQQRASDAGYSGSVGENIAFRGSTGPINADTAVVLEHQDLFVDSGIEGRGHRVNILFDSYGELGNGVATGLFTQGSTTFNGVMLTEDFGVPSSGSVRFLTGLAFNDTVVGDAFYSIGEGRSGVGVSADASTTTGASGGYSLALGTGAQTVTFSGGGLATAISVSIAAGSSNVKLDVFDGATILSSADVTLLSGAAGARLLGVADLAVTGAGAAEALSGNKGNNALSGNGGGDILTGGAGDDVLAGGPGFDTAVFSGVRAAYTIARSGLDTRVIGPDGTDRLTGLEQLQFSDVMLHITPSALLDTTGDGRSDLLWRNGDGDVVAWRMSGLQIAESHDFGVVPPTWRIVDAHGDYNADGGADLLWRNGDGAVALWQTSGLNIAASRDFGVVPTTWSIVNGHADFNGDGAGDVLWRDAGGQVALWQMSGANISASRDFGVVAPSYSIVEANADFNADGRSDILWRNSDGGVVAWQMSGLNIEASRDFGIVPAGWAIADVHGDYNGDGRSDVLWRGPDGMVSLWQMNGLNIEAARDIGMVANTWTIVDGHGDYDGDGNTDVLWRNSDGTVSVWLMNGLNIAAARDVGVVANSWTIVDGHADFNADGKSDILWRDRDGTVTAWQMSGVDIAASQDFGAVPPTWRLADAMEAGATLNGDAGSNTLLGTLNRDSLFGKAGNDTLTGGSGADRFVFDTALNGATNVDTITDFTPGSDKLVLSEVIFTSLTAGNLNPANLVSGASPVAQDADDFILYSTSTGQLSYDADASGAGTAIVFAVLSNRALLTANEVEIGAV